MQSKPRQTSNARSPASFFADLTAAWSLRCISSMMTIACPDESTRTSYSCMEPSSSRQSKFSHPNFEFVKAKNCTVSDGEKEKCETFMVNESRTRKFATWQAQWWTMPSICHYYEQFFPTNGPRRLHRSRRGARVDNDAPGLSESDFSKEQPSYEIPQHGNPNLDYRFPPQRSGKSSSRSCSSLNSS